SNAPIKFYQYKDRIEIINPGGLYGNARPENFPTVNDYRNPVIAEAMKVLGFVNRFNRGIARVKKELADNGNSEAIFDYKKIGVFGVTVFDALYQSIKTLKAETGKFSITPGEATFVVPMKNPEKVLTLIEEDGHITIPEIADKIGISVKGVEKIISTLKKEDRIERVGSRKTGYWLVIK
ncbi:MAG: winged helix-turn-helix transcriptional regulator, partial [Bacteroidales bacterium]|nr:winged helix-turn-helix transcriptional regulator [Bacteroidales bacterium]